MAVLIKNIILYEPNGTVAGFLEIRPRNGKTNLRLKQSFTDRNLMLSLTVSGENKVFKIDGNVCEYTVDGEMELEFEIFACIVRQANGEVDAIASGAINLNKLKAVAEIDNIIKKVCTVDEHGNAECDKCPYRDYFFTGKGA